MIVKEGTPNYANVIVDTLGRAFSGFRSTDGAFPNIAEVEYFWSCSPSSSETTGIGLGTLFFKNPITIAKEKK